MIWSVVEVYMLFEDLSREIYPKYQCHQISIRPMCRLTGSDRSPFRFINNRPPVRTDVPRALPPIRTSSLEHLPSQPPRPMNAKHWPLSVIIRVTI